MSGFSQTYNQAHVDAQSSKRSPACCLLQDRNIYGTIGNDVLACQIQRKPHDKASAETRHGIIPIHQNRSLPDLQPNCMPSTDGF